MNTKIDISHINLLSQTQQQVAQQVINKFYKYLPSKYKDNYLHLDVKQEKGKIRQNKLYNWRAVMTTNNGRFYAEGKGYGVHDSLSRTLEGLKHQLVKQARIKRH